MKKFGVAITTLSLLLTACGFFGGEDVSQDVEHPSETTLQGTVDKIDEDTIILTTDSGVAVELVSRMIDLRPYLQRAVEVTGLSVNDKLFEVDDVLVLGSREGTWENLKSTNLGVSISYRSFWTHDESQEQAALTFLPYPVLGNASVDTMKVVRMEQDAEVDLREYLKLNDSYEPNDATDTSLYVFNAVGPDQLPSVKKTSTDALRVEFYVARGKYLYVLSHENANKSRLDYYRNIFYDMLNSFRFIPIDDEDSVEDDAAPVVDADADTDEEPVLEPEEETTPEPATEPIVEPVVEPIAEPIGVEDDEDDEEVSEVADEDTVPEGYRLLESRGFHIDLYYPKNWWWAQFGSVIGFATEEMDDVLEAVIVLQKSTSGTLPKNEEGGELQGKCIELDGDFFCLSENKDAPTDDVSAMLQSADAILGSIKENDL